MNMIVTGSYNGTLKFYECYSHYFLIMNCWFTVFKVLEYIKSRWFLNLDIIGKDEVLNQFYFHSLGYPEIPMWIQCVAT